MAHMAVTRYSQGATRAIQGAIRVIRPDSFPPHLSPQSGFVFPGLPEANNRAKLLALQPISMLFTHEV